MEMPGARRLYLDPGIFYEFMSENMYLYLI